MTRNRETARGKLSPRAFSPLVDGNALSDCASRNFKHEIAGRIIKIERERAAMGVALIAKDQRLVQVDRAQEISTRIVGPYSVRKLESLRRGLFPRAEADVSGPWIDVWVVNFGAASIPDLECLLDSLISNLETYMPKSNDGRVDCPASGYKAFEGME